MRLSIRISDHDMGVRINQAEDFLRRGDKVKGEIVLRGRERAYAALGTVRLNEFAKRLQEEKQLTLNIEQPVQLVNNRLTILFGLK